MRELTEDEKVLVAMALHDVQCENCPFQKQDVPEDEDVCDQECKALSIELTGTYGFR